MSADTFLRCSIITTLEQYLRGYVYILAKVDRNVVRRIKRQIGMQRQTRWCEAPRLIWNYPKSSAQIFYGATPIFPLYHLIGNSGDLYTHQFDDGVWNVELRVARWAQFVMHVHTARGISSIRFVFSVVHRALKYQLCRFIQI